MGSLNILSSAMQLIWPMLSIATFVVCLQIQGRNKGANGPSLLVAGSALVMASSLINTVLRMMLINGGLDMGPITSFFSLTSVLSLVGQVLFLIGLYQFGMGQQQVVEGFDDLLDR